MNIKINIEVIYHLQTHIYKNKTDLNMRTTLVKKKVNELNCLRLEPKLLPMKSPVICPALIVSTKNQLSVPAFLVIIIGNDCMIE